MRGDQPRLWAQTVQRTEMKIDRVDIGDGSGGFMEPSVSVFVGTVMWVNRVVEKARAHVEAYARFPDGDVPVPVDTLDALAKALELDTPNGEQANG